MTKVGQQVPQVEQGPLKKIPFAQVENYECSTCGTRALEIIVLIVVHAQH